MIIPRIVLRSSLALLVLGQFPAAAADQEPSQSLQKQHLALAGIFANDMVLQQQADAAIWGKTEPNETVSIAPSWSGKTARAKADAEGRWRTTLRTPKAGGPFQIKIESGDESIELKNVLSGEVWICSGQSNMQWKLRGFGPEQFKDDVAKAKHPEIRFCDVPQVLALEGQQEVRTRWSVCNPQTAYNFSAVGYFFGSRLHQELDVPIGLISTNWGGSSAEAWVSPKALTKNFPEFDETMQGYQQIGENSGILYPRGKKTPKGLNQRNPAVLYNSMIKPLAPFAIRGVIWYQGESNVKNPVQYRELFPTLIRDWRSTWDIGNFPFYFVQIAPFHYKNEAIPVAFLREAQAMALSVPNTGMAVTMDIGESDNIHPREKKPVGERLALLALTKDYGKTGTVDSGPLYKASKIEANKMRLAFSNLGSGLASSDGGELTHFSIAGKDRNFVAAEAVIAGDTIVVGSKEVTAPVAVRYAWGNADRPNLTNKEGLPAPSFRTDDWAPDKP